MALLALIKRLQDIMRNDAGVGGDEQRLSQIIWILFLKVFDDKEREWEFIKEDYTPIIPDGYRKGVAVCVTGIFGISAGAAAAGSQGSTQSSG